VSRESWDCLASWFLERIWGFKVIVWSPHLENLRFSYFWGGAWSYLVSFSGKAIDSKSQSAHRWVCGIAVADWSAVGSSSMFVDLHLGQYFFS